MYCGSCLRDNALAAELLARGHDVTLTPVYTPTRTDEPNVSRRRVFFGGISVFLEQHSSLFRHTPGLLDRLWDADWAIRMASKRQIKVDPKSLGELTVSMLRGEQGFQRKEIDKLLDWLRTEPQFDVINLPYSLLLGIAEPLKRTLRAPVCCTLQGEDLFLDGLGEPYRQQALDLIRERGGPRRRVSPRQPVLLPLHARLPRRAAREDASGSAGHQSRWLSPAAAASARTSSPSATLPGSHQKRACSLLADAYRLLRTTPRDRPVETDCGRLSRARAPAISRRHQGGPSA